jgi:hypothetical protein
MTIVVAQDSDGQLMLTAGSQPTYKLVPHLGCSFVIAELAGFRVEFRRRADGSVHEVIFHQPNGTFAAPRAST